MLRWWCRIICRIAQAVVIRVRDHLMDGDCNIVGEGRFKSGFRRSHYSITLFTFFQAPVLSAWQ